tara:strand:- start:777 stop:1136 length:360 start_codon:yes stop_codon:yes gene_type:complete
MTPDFLQIALNELVPDYPDWYSWAKIDSKGNKIPNDQRMQTEHVIVNSVHKEIVTRPTDKQINDKIAELKKQDADKEYQKKRLAEYPSVQECIHAILDDDLTALQAKRKLVKEKYPKPE